MEGLDVVEAFFFVRSAGKRLEGLGRFGSLGSSGAGLAEGAVGGASGPAASSAAVIGPWDFEV